MHPALLVGIVTVIGATAVSAGEQARTSGGRAANVHLLEEMTSPQVDALNRERTLFILPVGMIEQHGPHLPVGADTLAVVHETEGVAATVGQALADWNVVIMPSINYGHGGANLMGDLPVHPGTYAVRQSTIRSLVADVGAQLAQNGFKWIFVANGHAAPAHAIAINEACDFVSETLGVTMLHLTALFRGDAAIQAAGEKMAARFFSAAERSSFGMDVHAGVGETAGMLAVRPDLVSPAYKTLPSRTGHSFEELRAVATRPGWQGYLSDPAKATLEYGRAVETWWTDGFADLILRAVRGENMLVRARVPETVPPPFAPILDTALAREAAFEQKLQGWLAQRRKR